MKSWNHRIIHFLLWQLPREGKSSFVWKLFLLISYTFLFPLAIRVECHVILSYFIRYHIMKSSACTEANEEFDHLSISQLLILILDERRKGSRAFCDSSSISTMYKITVNHVEPTWTAGVGRNWNSKLFLGIFGWRQISHVMIGSKWASTYMKSPENAQYTPKSFWVGVHGVDGGEEEK